MSTFTLDDNRFLQILATLQHRDYSGNGCKYNFLLNLSGREWDEYGVPNKFNKNNQDFYGLHRLVGAWRANNNRAFRTRYPSHEVYRVGSFKNVTGTAKIMTPVELLKCLQALSYNMDDHQCPTLERMIPELMNIIIEQLPEYKAASYG